MKASTSAIVVALHIGVGLFAQAPPAFEVASIRVHSFASAGHAGPPIAGNRGTFGGNLKQLIIYAYDLKVYQLDGGPSWVEHPSTDTDYYDISAKAEGDEPLTEPRPGNCCRQLLADRSTEAAPGIERDASLRLGRWQDRSEVQGKCA